MDTFRRFRRFIRELQESGADTKRRWLIGATTVTMIFVIILWVVYLDSSIPNVGGPAGEEEAVQRQDVSFTESFSRGVGVLSDRLGKWIGSVEDIFDKRKTYKFDPPN